MNNVVRANKLKSKQNENTIQINDKVRVILKRKTFAKKSFERIWSEEVYTIVGKNGYRYLLELNKSQLKKLI
jgi:hypothetical protein